MTMSDEFARAVVGVIPTVSPGFETAILARVTWEPDEADIEGPSVLGVWCDFGGDEPVRVATTTTLKTLVTADEDTNALVGALVAIGRPKRGQPVGLDLITR